MSNASKSKLNQRLDYAISVSAVSLLTSLIAIFLIVLHWNSGDAEPDVPYIAVSVTVVQTFVAVAALGGFWLIREAALRKAEQAAREFLEIKYEEIKSDAVAAARRAALEFLPESNSESQGTGDDIAQALNGDRNDG